MTAKNAHLRIHPQAVELEEAILGAVLLEKTALDKINHLQPHHFYMDRHRMLFEHILKLRDSGYPVDLLTLQNAMKKTGDLEKIGGVFALIEITDRVASSANIEYHARIVEEKWMLREIIRLGQETAELAFDEPDPFEVLNAVDAGLNRINSLREAGGHSADQVLDKLEQKARHVAGLPEGAVIGLPIFGIPDLEQLTQGAEPGDVIAISGAPGSGKSSLFNNILTTCATSNIPVFSWSGELTETDQMARILAAKSGVNSMKIRSGYYLKYQDTTERVREAQMELKGAPVYLAEGSMGLQKIAATVNSYYKKGVRLFLFDRLELFDLAHSRDEEKAKGMITTRFRQIANEYGVSIVFAVQLRKEYEKRAGAIPTVTDILGTGAVGHDAKKILMVYRPEIHRLETFPDGDFCKGRADLMLLKNTDGGIGTVRTDFHATRTIFGNPAFEPLPF